MKLSYFSYDFWECCCVAPLVFRAPEAPAAREARASLRSAPLLEARPCPPVPPAPSTPAAPVADMRLGASSRSPARPCRHPRAPQPGPSPATRPYEREKIRPARLHQHPRAKKFAQRMQNTPKSAFFRLLSEFIRADVARADSQHLPTTLPETDDTNAGGSLPRYETAGTSASSFPHTVETTDTFARTKRPIPGHFLPAKASRVSCTPRRAPAKAITVSRTAPQPPAKASPVSPSPDATPTAQTSCGLRTRHNAGGTLAT